VTKPFSPREVVARVKAVLRRASGQVRADPPPRSGALTVDLDAFEARCGEPLALSPTQLRLLATLAARPGKAFHRHELLEAQPSGFADERTVDAHVKNLRQRLGACSEQLETVRGVGYRLRP
jgi:DNA-binding response OmpR family regulator